MSFYVNISTKSTQYTISKNPASYFGKIHLPELSVSWLKLYCHLSNFFLIETYINIIFPKIKIRMSPRLI